MSKFAEGVLKLFGMSAKEAKDEQEMDTLVSTAMTALDAEPAGVTPPPPPEAAPAVSTPDPAISALDAKLDKLIELLSAKDAEPEEEHSLDKAIEDLEGREKEESEDPEVIPADDGESAGPARDAALAMLKTMRPVIASIEDAATRKKVTDALLGAVRTPDMLGGIMQAAQQSARKAADSSAATSFEKMCEAQKAAYDARNPHKQKEGK